MKCDHGQLSDYRDGELSPERRRALEDHLRGCEGCRKVLADYEGIARAIRALPRYEAADTLARDVKARVKAEHQGVTTWLGLAGLPRFGSLVAVTVVAILAAVTMFRLAPEGQTGLQASAPVSTASMDRDAAGPAPIAFKEGDSAGATPMRAQDRGVAGSVASRPEERGEAGPVTLALQSRDAAGPAGVQQQDRELPAKAALYPQDSGASESPARRTQDGSSAVSPQQAPAKGTQPPQQANPPAAAIAGQAAPVGPDPQVVEAPVPAAPPVSAPSPGQGPGSFTGQREDERGVEVPRAVAAQPPAAAPAAPPVVASSVQTGEVVEPPRAVISATVEPGRGAAQVPAASATESFTGPPQKQVTSAGQTSVPRLFEIVAGVEITASGVTTATIEVTRGIAITSTSESGL